MKRNYNSDTSKPERKIIEKNRRILMKSLCFKLASLIPTHHSLYKGATSLQGGLDHTAIYVKELKESVEKLKREKQTLIGRDICRRGDAILPGSTLPILELQEMDSALVVTLISSWSKSPMFSQVISVLQEEGALVVNASLYRASEKIFHTFHCEVLSSRVGVESSRLFQRLKDLLI